MIHTPDTDVVVIAVGLSTQMSCELFVKTGVKDKTRIISISRIVQQLHSKYNIENTTETTDAVLGFHAFTGCDTVSAFWRKGKRRPWSLMMTDSNFIALFAELGRNWELEEESVIPRCESFVCAMYGSRTCKNVNTLRYQTFPFQVFQ